MQQKKIISIGLNGFPKGTAPVQKLKMMGKAIIEEGVEFCVIRNSFVKKTKLTENLNERGNVEGIDYILMAPHVFTPNSFVTKVYSRVAGKVNEFFYILSLYRNKNISGAIVYCNKFIYSLFWGLMFKLLKIPSYLVYFELRSSVDTRKKWYLKLNDKMYDRFMFYFHDGFFVISQLLTQHINKYTPNKPKIYLPPIVDFALYDSEPRLNGESYFLYCGSLSYFDVIRFIVDSYEESQVNTINLKLVVNGSTTLLKKLHQLIEEKSLKEKVEILSGVSNKELVGLYVNSNALLIPLRDTAQDIARFPHKVAEYCAANSPIVSTKYGEIARLFDDTSALLAEKFDVKMFAEKLRYVEENPDQSRCIGNNSYKLGKDKFDYRKYSKPILESMLSDR
ncbi:glycosyltransferase [Labilibacter marinus]|uniref:glycosyltransferase n=1 Tax=Labilibacter marinus TaxID=1477105 RepID=UPI000829C082|nr:glycosyltransferase [Labilibacter marinus]